MTDERYGLARDALGAAVRVHRTPELALKELEARISAFLAFAHPERVRSLVFGGLGINMVRGVAGTGPVAHALEAATIDEVTNPTARTFRAFAEQTKSDLKALAACIRSARRSAAAEPSGVEAAVTARPRVRPSTPACRAGCASAGCGSSTAAPAP